MTATPLCLAALAVALAGCTADAPSEPVRPEPVRPAPARPAPAAAAPALFPDSLAGTFDGYYSSGFEYTGFLPCADTTEAWWTEPAKTETPIAGNQTRVDWTPAADVYARYQAIVGDSASAVGEGVVVWTRLRGRATSRGEYGHLGAYARAFAVDSVEAMSTEAPAGACARPSHVRP